MRSGPSSAAERLIPRGVSTPVLAVALVALVVVPLVDLIRSAVAEVGAGGSAVWSRGGTTAIAHSLVTSSAATCGAVIIGVGGALATARRRPAAVRMGMLLALLVPPFVSAVAWARAFGPGGLTDDLFGFTMPGLIGPVGISVVMAVHAAPIVYLLAAASLATRARPELEWAARSSGASRGMVLRVITLPLLGPAIAGGAALAFVVSMNSFGIPAVLGIPAGYPTITTRIYGDLVRSADPAAFSRVVVLSMALVVMVLAVVLAADRVMRRAVPAVPAAREPIWPTAPRRGSWAMWGYLGVAVAVPLVALVLTALTRAVGLAPWPNHWTLGNFREAWTVHAWSAGGRSLLLAATAATIVTLLALVAAGGRPGVGDRGLAGITSASFAVPGSALAVAVLLAYGPWLRDTMLIILIAYLAKFWALAQRSVGGSAGALDREVVRAARISGASPTATLLRILLPMLRPALAAAWLVVFLFGMHELTISSLLYGPGTATLAVVTLEVQQLGDITVTAALAVLLTVPGVAAAVVIGRREPR